MQHSIRIFLSSTFKDLQKERDYLVNKVFPALRIIAEERGIPFSWCDLRFGVSDLNNSNLNIKEEYIIRICLKNIEQSDGDFLGLIGEHYGSVPTHLSSDEFKRLSLNFRGIDKLLKQELGYTDIEMRFFINNHDKTKGINLFYFTTPPDSFLKNNLLWRFLCFFNKSNKDKVLKWKRYILAKIMQSKPNIWFCNDQISVEKDTIFNTLKSIIENNYEKPKFPQEEFVFNEQKQHYKALSQNHLNIGQSDKENEIVSVVDKSDSDIIMISGNFSIGKTNIVLSALNEQLSSRYLIFFHFVGVSRTFDSPTTIFRHLLYQICEYTNDDFGLYNSNDVLNITGNIKKIIDTIQKPVLIFIDGLDDSVMWTKEQKNTFISIFPEPTPAIKYIITGPERIESNRVRNIHLIPDDLCTRDTIKRFVDEFALNNYGYQKGLKIFDRIKSLKIHNLREIEYYINEIVVQKETFDISANLYDSIYIRLKKDLVFYKDSSDIDINRLDKALIKIALLDYGVAESDICRVLDIDPYHWTIIYSFLKPYLCNKGNLKLIPELQDAILNYSDNVRDFRIELLHNLIELNRSALYIMEVLNQSYYLGNIQLVKTLGSIDVFTYMYENEKDIMADYILKLNEEEMLLLKEELLHNIKTFEPKVQFKCMLPILDTFLSIVPRYKIAQQLFSSCEDIISNQTIESELILQFYGFYIEYYAKYGVFDQALDLLRKFKNILSQKENETFEMKALMLEAAIFDIDFQETNEQKKAIPIYEQLLSLLDVKSSTDNYLYVLDRYIMLTRGCDSVGSSITEFEKLFNDEDIVVKNSRLYCKYLTALKFHELITKKYSAESSDLDDYFKCLFGLIQQNINLYKANIDNIRSFDYAIHLMNARAVVCCKRHKNYNKYREITLDINKQVDLYKETIEFHFGKLSYEYVSALFTITNVYKKLSHTSPSNQDKYCTLSMNYAKEIETILYLTSPQPNLITSKLYNNLSGWFLKKGNYDKALEYIDKAIAAKVELGLIYKKTYFVSIDVKIDIFLDYIKRHDDFEDYKLQAIQLINEYKQTANQFGDTEAIENSIKKSNEFYNLISSAQNRKLSLAYELFERAKRIHEEGQKELFEEEKNKVIEYLRTNQIEEAFSKTHSGYVNFKNSFKKDLLSEMESLVNAMNDINEILKKN